MPKESPPQNVDAYFAQLEEKGIDPYGYKETHVTNATVIDNDLNPELYHPTRRDEYIYRPKTKEGDLSSRASRGIGQYLFEGAQEKFMGKGVLERFINIREALFKMYPRLRENTAVTVRNTDVYNSITYYPGSEVVQKDLLPQYTRVVDGLYESVLDMPEGSEKEKAAVRFAAVSYSLGILIHPYEDGNGQTFRLLSWSYLKELTPKTVRDVYFRFKLGSGGDVSPTTLEIDKLKADLAAEREAVALRALLKPVHDSLRRTHNLGVGVEALKNFFVTSIVAKKVFKSSTELTAFVMEKFTSLDTLVSNSPFTKETVVDERLALLTNIISGYSFNTVDHKGRQSLRPRVKKDENLYWDIYDYFSIYYSREFAYNKISYSNALDLFKEEKQKLEKEKAGIEEQQQQEFGRSLTAFLQETLLQEGALMKYVQTGKLDSEIKRGPLLQGMLDNFVLSIEDKGERKRIFEEGDAHTQAAKKLVAIWEKFTRSD